MSGPSHFGGGGLKGGGEGGGGLEMSMAPSPRVARPALYSTALAAAGWSSLVRRPQKPTRPRAQVSLLAASGGVADSH